MRIRSPRLFALAASTLMCLPLTIGLLQTGQNDLSQYEGRLLAPWPHLPRSAKEWRTLPTGLDAFVADHFGLRDVMIHLQNLISYLWLREANPDVLIGLEGRLFYYGDDAIAQSAGETLRIALIQHTIDVVADMQALLSARGIKFVAASPPNAASIYEEDLPLWARNRGRETEPNLILKGLKARGVTVVDLRQTLRAARDQGNLYLRSDTHWTLLGGVIGYDAIASGAGHPDWTIIPDTVLGPSVRFGTGDLARMLGAGIHWEESVRDWAVPSAPIESVGRSDDALELSSGVRAGPAVLILGDSFTEGTFATLMASHVGRIGWLRNLNCSFDWSWISTFKPDEVWWAPTERLILCLPQTWPNGMPHRQGSADDSAGREGARQ